MWNNLLILFTIIELTIATFGFAAPRRYSYDEESSTMLREMRDSLSDVSHEVSNHEAEIRRFAERLNNQELTIESMRQQVLDSTQTHKEMVKGSSAGFEGKLAELESTTKGLVADIRQFKTHANETAAALTQYKQKLIEIEKVMEAQNQSMDSMQAALRSLMELLQTKEVASSKGDTLSSKIYRVKNGDSLEKIARNNGTTVQILKDLNNLTSDRIIVGQKLQLP